MVGGTHSIGALLPRVDLVSDDQSPPPIYETVTVLIRKADCDVVQGQNNKETIHDKYTMVHVGLLVLNRLEDTKLVIDACTRWQY